ncbi:MAG: tyrosine-type recombinase/integrase [Anaerolineales bacterium]|nr:tyrosine-type recombinase/integrase [Anaerolineales bacterium]
MTVKTDKSLQVAASDLMDWLEAYLIAKRSARLSPRTVEFYAKGLTDFFRFATQQGAESVREINALLIRKYLLSLESRGRNPGGVHALYRCVRAFLYWYELEDEPLDWSNPIRKIKVKYPTPEPLEPADIAAIHAILADCKTPLHKKDCEFLGLRDKTIILFLLDTGARASELISLAVSDVNPITGVVHIRHGKGDKHRTVYIGKKTRQALRAYLREVNPDSFLWVNNAGEPLTRSGLRQMLIERAKRAGVKPQQPHSFRRLFALTMLRNGVDVYSLQLLMGHADLQILKVYLKLSNSDTLNAHIKGSPVDKLI